MQKEIQVKVDGRTWPKGRAPSYLLAPAGTHNLNMAAALLMLGTLTTPDILSSASPARFWAWVRYFLAPSASADLRVTMDFASLDPHQKGILSDDFGVATSTQWLFDKLGGFQTIVDGRRFMTQFAHLLPPKTKVAKAKVGPTKAPDFVIQDHNDRWHVLECKGTQSGRGARDAFLKSALSQKRVINISRALRGERLAIGLALSNENDRQKSQLRIVDPDADAILALKPKHKAAMEESAYKISVARALGVIGMNEMAIELALPFSEHISEFLRPNESLRLRSPSRDRLAKARDQMKERRLGSRTISSTAYIGRSVSLDQFDVGELEAISRLKVGQWVNKDLIDLLANSERPLDSDTLRSELAQFKPQNGIDVQSDGTSVTLRYGDIMVATLDLN